MLRLLWQELVFRRNAIIGWSLGLCFFPLVYIAIYPSVADQMAGFADLELYQAMGMSTVVCGPRLIRKGITIWIGASLEPITDGSSGS